jgi:FKBP-type peptidyl-prolyl cis-trans isomerase FkpA
VNRLVLILFIAFSFQSCDKELTRQERLDQEIIEIEAYIVKKGWTAQKTSEGVYYVIEVPGSIDKPSIIDQVTVNYKGTFLDDVIFDEGDNIKFSLSSVIQGWQIGIPKFGKGGKGKLIIPSLFAYEERDIEGRTNAILSFEIELLDF